jgi:hypothetical protein
MLTASTVPSQGRKCSKTGVSTDYLPLILYYTQGRKCSKTGVSTDYLPLILYYTQEEMLQNWSKYQLSPLNIVLYTGGSAPKLEYVPIISP